jgi:hypothetical protein
VQLQVLLLHAVGGGGDLGELGGQVDVGPLVGHAGGVEEHGEQLQAAGRVTGLLHQLAGGGVLGILTGAVPQAGRDLQQPPVDGGPVLPDQQRLGAIGAVEHRHHRHRAG